MTFRTAVSDAQLMEIGEAVAGGMKPGLAARHFSLSKSTIYRALRHYEKVTGEKLIGPSTMQKSQMRKAAKAKAANGTTALTPVADGAPWQARALAAEQRVVDLTDQLELATDEVHTLQKIIITLGRAL